MNSLRVPFIIAPSCLKSNTNFFSVSSNVTPISSQLVCKDMKKKVKLPNNLNLFIVFLQQKNCLTKAKEALYDKGKALNQQY